MALTYPIPQIIPEEFVDAADWNALVDSINFLANPPLCRVYGAAQSLAHQTDVVVAFNAERQDWSVTAMHDLVTNNSRITIPVAGAYVASFVGRVPAASDYISVRAQIRLNGATPIAYSSWGTWTDNTSTNAYINVTSPVHDFAAGDYLEVLVKQRNGAGVARNLEVEANASPEFGVHWVGLAA